MVCEATLKPGLLSGPQIRMLVNDSEFTKTPNPLETNACQSLVDVTQNFHRNHHADNYKETVETTIQNYSALSSRLSLKLNFFHSRLDFFPSII